MKPTERLNIVELDEDTLPSGNRLFLWVLTCVLGLTTLILCFISQPLFYPELKIGDVAFHDLSAHIRADIADEGATKQAQLKARNSVVPVFKQIKGDYGIFNTSVQKELSRIKALQNKIHTNHPAKDSVAEEKKAPEYYEIYIASTVPAKQFDAFANKFSLSAQKANRALPRFSVQENTFWQPAVEEFLPDDWAADLKKQAAILICHLLSPNLMIDENATFAKAESLTKAMQPVMKRIEPGMVLLKRGQVVDENNISLLEAGGIKGQIRWPLIFILALSLLASSALVGVYLYTYKRQN